MKEFLAWCADFMLKPRSINYMDMFAFWAWLTIMGYNSKLSTPLSGIQIFFVAMIGSLVYYAISATCIRTFVKKL